jgi:hypothetical protein
MLPGELKEAKVIEHGVNRTRHVRYIVERRPSAGISEVNLRKDH